VADGQHGASSALALRLDNARAFNGASHQHRHVVSDMADELAQRRSTQVQPTTNPTSLPTAVESIIAGLKQAVAGMDADDISVELSAWQEGERSTARFHLRAYRRGNKIVDREGK
jgi:hypothetical protein